MKKIIKNSGGGLILYLLLLLVVSCQRLESPPSKPEQGPGSFPMPTEKVASPELEILDLKRQEEEAQTIIESKIYQKERSAGAVPTEAIGKASVVDVFYSTTRKQSGAPEPNFFYGSERISSDSSMEFGTVKVSIPPFHEKGQIERPWTFVSFEFQE